MSSPPHMRMETDPVSETLYSLVLECRTMDKVRKPSNSDNQNESDQLLGILDVTVSLCCLQKAVATFLYFAVTAFWKRIRYCRLIRMYLDYEHLS
jgi:hypothetical protein